MDDKRKLAIRVAGFLALPTLLLLLCGRSVWAETEDSETLGTVYVNVTLSNLRSGPGAQYSTVGAVSKGKELEVIDEANDWYKVSSPTSRPGWIIQKAVTFTPPPKVVVRQLERKIIDLQSDNERLTKEIQRLSDTRQDLELAASQLKTDVMVLKQKNEEFKSWRTVVWVILGLVIHLTGWGLGFVAGMFRKQADDKRYDTLMKEAASKKA